MAAPRRIASVMDALVEVVLASETVAVKGATGYAIPQEQQAWGPRATGCQD